MGLASMKNFTAVAVTACLALASVAGAGTINLNMEGLDLMYDGPANVIRDLSSLGTPAGGNLDVDESDRLDAATFTFDDTVVEQYTESNLIYADILVENLPSMITAPDINSIPDPGPVTFVLGDNEGGFGFDWFNVVDDVVESSLELNFDQVVVTLMDTGAGDPIITISASTTDWTSFNLPGLLAFDPGTLLRFSYTAQNTSAAPNNAEAYDVVFGMKGVATISGEGTNVPEPTAAYLLLVGMGSAVAIARYRLG